MLSLRDTLGKMASDAVEREIGGGPSPNIEVDYGNAVFRIFIWQDMIGDISREKAFLWGINFGQPQRSKKIEVLEWAREEWEKDGWITPHNSYLHMVYRAGIVGAAIIIAMFWVYGWMVKTVVETSSVIGILLLTVLIYFMAIAPFLVFYEFPYSAIPFWSLYGMMLAYCVEKRKERLAQSGLKK